MAKSQLEELQELLRGARADRNWNWSGLQKKWTSEKENELNNHPDSDARTTKKYKEKSVCNMSDISMKKFLF